MSRGGSALNTVILLTSGVIVTGRHFAIARGERVVQAGLLLTIVLGRAVPVPAGLGVSHAFTGRT